MIAANTTSHRFLFSNFRYYLTFFSKYFSSFPHGTCSLSVSHQYLALDGIYHPLRAAIPNNSTRRKLVVRPEKQVWTGLSPSSAVRSRTLYPPSLADFASPGYNSEDFQPELFPLHSPLLRESWLVSFPPPSYMLKFSGYSWLIGGPIGYLKNKQVLLYTVNLFLRRVGFILLTSRPIFKNK